jgi:hypothetical protein
LFLEPQIYGKSQFYVFEFGKNCNYVWIYTTKLHYCRDNYTSAAIKAGKQSKNPAGTGFEH